MGFISNMHRGQRDVDKLLKQDLENRVRQFLEEYKTLVRKYRCSHRAVLDFVSGGAGGIIPKIIVMDATTMLEEERIEEEKAEEEKNKEKEKNGEGKETN